MVIYPGVATENGMVEVDVAGGATVPISITLPYGAHMSGTITDGGVPVDTGSVEVAGDPSSVYGGSTGETAADGTWDADVWPGDYILKFKTHPGSGRAEYWDDVVARDSATSAHVEAQTSTVFDVDLATSTDGGRIDFSFTAPGGGVADDGCVDLYDAGGTSVTYSCYPVGGVYSLSVVAGESYYAKMTSFAGAAAQWYGGVASQNNATAIPVTLGATTTLSAPLIAEASVSGTLTAQGEPLTTGAEVDFHGPEVDLWDPDNETLIFNAQPDGTYTADHLFPGTYHIVVIPYDDSLWLSNLEPVTLAAGESATIDADLELISDVSGTITDGTSPVSGAAVELRNYYDGVGAGVYDVWETTTDPSGHYSFGDLRPGTYYLLAGTGPAGANTWYDGASDVDTATPISVPGGSVVVDMVVEPTATIYGTVTDGVAPLSGWVELYDDSFNYLGYAYADGEGAYYFTGLADGDYVVHFQYFDGYTPEWYDDAADFGSATRITISGPGTVVADAVLDAKASISGTVTLPGGGAAGVGAVTLYDAEQNSVDSAWTPDGTYSFDYVRPGTYYLRFEGFDGGANTWYGGTFDFASATAVTVAAGEDLTKDQELLEAATITGTVSVTGATGAVSGRVDLYDSSGELLYSDFPSFSDGSTYAFGSLPPGDYYLSFHDFDWGGLDEWYDGGTDLASATPVTLSLGQDIVVDQQLDAGPTISGTVTASDTGLAIPNAVVQLRDSGGNLSDLTQADADGNWAISTTGRPSFNYTIVAGQDEDTFDWFGFCSGTYACKFWGGGYSEDSATWFPMTSGASVTGMDIALDPAASISGTVTGTSDPSGLDQVDVTAWLVDDPSANATVQTDASGSYTVPGLPAGDYKVAFIDGCSSSDYFCATPRDYAPTYWDGRGSATAADAIAISEGDARTGIDAVLGAGATLSGRVTDVDNPSVGLEGVQVEVIDLAGGYVSGYDGYLPQASHVYGATSTDTDGYYTLAIPLGAGDYKVHFAPSDYGTAKDFAPAWSGGATFVDDASVLTISDTSPVTVNGALHRGGSISGTITRDGNQPFEVRPAMPSAYLYNATAGEWQKVTDESVWADPSTGAYIIPGLNPGTYRVGFHDHVSNVNYLPVGWEAGTPTVYYDGASTVGAATDVTVTGGATTSGIDGLLTSTTAELPVISGIVPTAGPTGGGAPVVLTGTGFTDATSVTFDGVEGTGLSVSSDTQLSVAVPAHGAPGAIDVVVTTPAGSSDPVAFTYFEGDAEGGIRGTVTGPGGVPAGPGSYSINYYGEGLGTDGDVGVDGTFVQGVVPGDYQICFFGFADLADACYDDGSGEPLSDQVSVGAGEIVDVAIELAPAGTISGTVTDSSANPLSGGYVSVYTVSGDYAAVAAVGVDGTYDATNLAAGDYVVKFSGFDGYGSEWYLGQSSRAAATPVTVVAGSDASGVDAVLSAEGFISGYVTVPDEFTGTDACVGVYDAGDAFVGGNCYTVGEVFTIGGLGAGTYKVRVIDDDGSTVWGPGGWGAYSGIDAWYANADTFGSATGVPVTAGELVVVDLRWDAPAVTNVSPAEGPTTGGTTVTLTGTDFTDATGVTFDGVAGTGLSVVNDGELTVVSPAHAAGAVDVVVTTPYGSSPAATFTYTGVPGGTLEVTVTEPGETPHSIGGCVTVIGVAEEVAIDQCSSTDGVFSVDVPVDGDYYAWVTIDGYPSQFYGGVEFLDDPGAVAIPVAGGATVSVSYEVIAGATITGTVTLEGGGVPSGAGGTVNIYHTNLGSSDGLSLEADGSYAATWLFPGDYYVEFAGWDDARDEWYDNVATSGEATLVSVASGDVAVVDAQLSPVGTIAGTVTMEGGVPADGVTVIARTEWNETLGQTTTDSAGHYDLAGLAPGDVYLAFVGGPYVVPEYFDDAPTFAYATPVTVVAGGVATADAQLAPAGAIAGTVSLDSGGSAGYGDVSIFDAVGEFVASGVTESDGTYSIGSLPAGDYRIRFDGFATGAWEWYDEATSLSSATPVTVTANATTTANESLAAPSTISGTLTGVGGPGLGDVSLYYADSFAEDGMLSASTFTESDGTYTFTGLAAGDYLLRFRGDGASEWYDDQPSAAQATRVTVGVGEAVTGIDASLAPASEISGTLNVPDSFTNDEGYACVGAYIERDAANPVDSTCAPVGGSFSIEALPAATYYLRLIDSDYRFTNVNDWADFTGEDAWYDDVFGSAAATPIVLGSGLNFAVTLSWTSPLPAISVLAPSHGTELGGTEVTVTGTHLTGATSVTFDGVAGTSLSVTNDGELTVVTPAHVAGAVDVVVTTPFGTSDAGAFTYFVLPVVSQVSYASGPTGGGSPVVITGSGFTGATSVTFGGVASTSVSVSSDTRLVVAAPAHVAGSVDLVVTTPSGSSSPVTFSYYEGEVRGGIVGTVTGPGGVPAGPGHFEVSYYGQGLGTGGDVESDGSFVQIVVPDDYQVCFFEFVGLANACYDDGSGEPLSDVIGVAAGEVVDLSIELAPAGTISGTVTNGTDPLDGGFVSVTTASGERVPGGFAIVAADGTYTVTNLAAGNYLVEFSSFDGYGSQWYSGSSSQASATPVTVVAGSDTSGVDAVLGAEAFITGTVALPSDFVGTEACVGVYDAGDVFVNGNCYNVGDPFSIGGLSAGTYKVRIINDDGSIVWSSPDGWDAYSGPDAWYANADTFGSATGVTLAAGETAVIGLVWDEPAISDVSPTSGPTLGGTTVTLTGAYFSDATSVTFGGVAGTSLSVDSDTQITVTTPAHIAGAVDVVVTTPYGTSAAGTFTYVAPPAISDVSPVSGSTDGGTTVTLTGSGFTGATSVTFDGSAGTSLSVTNDGELTVVTPAHVAGAVDVVVTTAYGSSAAGTFTYVTPAPAITDVSPSSGSTDGGTSVTITGTHLTGATSVTFDGSAGASLSVTNDGELTVVTPAHAAGAVDVVVTTPAGSSSRRRSRM